MLIVKDLWNARHGRGLSRKGYFKPSDDIEIVRDNTWQEVINRALTQDNMVITDFNHKRRSKLKQNACYISKCDLVRRAVILGNERNPKGMDQTVSYRPNAYQRQYQSRVQES